MQAMGGRKFVLSLLGIVAVSVLAWGGKDAAAFGSIAIIVAGFVGGNSYVTGKHANGPDAPKP